jgi:hypothetical protein
MIQRPKPALIGALLACGVGGCVAQPTWPTPTQIDQAQAAANQVAEASKRFDIAASRTADGSRAYELVAHEVILLVRSDGGGVLLGAVNSPVRLSADAIRPFETDVAAAGFPDLPSARRSVCNDGSDFPEVFIASIGGHSVTAFGDACGEVAIPLDKAADALRALVDANGGPGRRGQSLQQVPRAVTVFTGAR